jgi:ATPase family associated with various cellular activities (AAA)
LLGHGRPFTELETALAALALAPDVDQKYERIYGYLHDDLSVRRPTLGLALDLLCADRADRLRLLAMLAPGGPGVGAVTTEGPVGSPLLARTLLLDPHVRDRLLGIPGLDERLAGAVSVEEPDVTPEMLPLGERLRQVLHAHAIRLRFAPGRVQVAGGDGPLLDAVARAVARLAGRPLLVVDAGRLMDVDRLATVVVREAERHAAVAQLRLAEPPGPGWARLAGRLERVVLTLPEPDDRLESAGFPVLAIPRPDAAVRGGCWAEAAEAAGLELDAEQRNDLATAYRLRACDIADAVRAARSRASLRDGGVPAYADVREAASEMAGHGVAGVARRVPISHGWDDLVLPEDSRRQLAELCGRVRHQRQVLDRWGMRQGASGSGLHALFSGPSGTGKTVGAQVVAGVLGLQLWKVDLSRIVSKYIGETEKNLDAVFSAAQDCDVVLLFDEADALFGKRSEVRDAHDRYANIEVSYLLQRMEEHDGVAVLATNLRQNLDAAFLRRLAFDIRFPFPDEAHRRLIWQRVFPPALPLDETVDAAALAAAYTFSGGQIRNVALAAAYLAAGDGGPVTADHVHLAACREFQKLGKPPAWPESEAAGAA